VVTFFCLKLFNDATGGSSGIGYASKRTCRKRIRHVAGQQPGRATCKNRGGTKGRLQDKSIYLVPHGIILLIRQHSHFLPPDRG